MEKAIHITNLKNLKYFQKNKYQRIYWGVEFCQNLIPTLKDTEEILRFIKKTSLKFTLVTPFVTEYGLRRLKEIVKWLKKKEYKSEIVVNDWGILECLNTEFKNDFNLSLGRLLLRQQRDPAIKKVLEKQLPFAIKGKDGKISIIIHQPPAKKYQQGIRATYINSPSMQRFLSKFGVQRVELNNIVQGINLAGLKFKKSIYTPYVNISSTRFCPMDSKHQKMYRINACKKECQRYYDILRNRGVGKIIYKRGNTTFYKDPLDIKEILDTGIDRVVFQPEIPF